MNTSSLLSNGLVGAILLAVAAPGQADGAQRDPAWDVLHERAGLSLRALAVVDRSTIWAGGTGGTILRSGDGGATFANVAPRVEGVAGFDFRDLHAFDASTAVAMVAGQPAHLYRTTDGGGSWQRVHAERDPAAFFDSIEFEGETGYLFGDPLGGQMYVRRSTDGGRTWGPVTGLPEAIEGEYGFAASGSCIDVTAGVARIVTGGARARCFSRRDTGRSWQSVGLPLEHGAPAGGAFAVTFDGRRGVVVGGLYDEPERAAGTAAWTADGGATWTRSNAGGFRSAVAWLDESTVLAVGSHGASRSRDGGRTWAPFGATGFHALERAADGTVIACGSNGRIARLAERAVTPFTVMALFGDHMVLPADATIMLRGHGPAQSPVAVTTSWGAETTTTVTADGSWRCAVVTPGQGGAHSLTLACDDQQIAIRDVLVGDVWLASGQSNMEMEVGRHSGWRQGVRNWEQEVAAADFPELRVFTVQKKTSAVPLDAIEGEWLVCSPATAGGFSASAYFFARELLQRGHGPIGLVVSAWGGTICEAWTSAPGLDAFPEFAPAIRRLAAGDGRDAAMQRFWSAVPGVPAPGDAAWQLVEMPDRWSESGLGDFDGVAFYRQVLPVPDVLRGRDLRLDLGAVDDMDTAWCNGQRIGGLERDGAWSTPRQYAIPGALVGARAELEIIVRVVDTGGEGGFTAAPAALQLITTSGAPEVKIELAGSWRRARGPAIADLPAWPRRAAGPNRPTVLFNGMIAPLAPFPFRGAIWYQGESNRLRAAQYERLFPAMIRDWRHHFGRDLPFYFVQIAPFSYAGERLGGVDLRWAQTQALRLPRTGMVVTLDIGNARDIHPRNKQAVGQRLALHALRHCYGENVVCDGPVAVGLEATGEALLVRFAASASPLAADGAVSGFEVRARGRSEFVPATARVVAADLVEVKAAGIEAPVAVRYAWTAVPDANLRNAAGLPAGPFRLALPR